MRRNDCPQWTGFCKQCRRDRARRQLHDPHRKDAVGPQLEALSGVQCRAPYGGDHYDFHRHGPFLGIEQLWSRQQPSCDVGVRRLSKAGAIESICPNDANAEACVKAHVATVATWRWDAVPFVCRSDPTSPDTEDQATERSEEHTSELQS